MWTKFSLAFAFFSAFYPVGGFRVTPRARWNDAIIFKDQWTKGLVLRLRLRLDEVVCVDRVRKPSRLSSKEHNLYTL
jgi:hypothetical protein